MEKLFSELAERYMERPGGYTRIVKLGYRRGDNAPISLIELVTEEYKAKRKRRKAKPKAEAKTASKKSSKKKSAEELGLVEEEKAVENQADEQGEAEVTETASKKKSAEEPGLVEEEEALEKRADEQGEAEVAEPEPPEPQEQADSPEKTED